MHTPKRIAPLTKLVLPVVALSAAAVLLLPERSEGWSTIGGSLSLAQRDFRIFDNFGDSTANNNLTPDANFPGYQGAVMAIWKGSVEWGSGLHGDGNGDPHQPGGLGSGGANFDPSFQGLATAVGSTNSNVHSEISGCSGGTLAFCELPISDGWRIRYYECWTYDDGPGTSIGNREDLQSIATHEYGHALGLGHSNAGGGPTMNAGYGGGVGPRSISTDDQNGVQAIYGAAAGSKPIVTGITLLAGNQLQIDGQNFSLSNNQVWFTQAGQGGTGNPIKVTNVSSSGSSMTVAIPGTAGPGDVLVQNDGNGSINLSNAWPFDPNSAPGCPSPQNFCISSPNSTGVGMVMDSSGVNTFTANDFALIANGGPPNSLGIFYFGSTQTAAPFGNGWRCVDGDVKRLPAVQLDIFGTAFFQMDLNVAPMNTIQPDQPVQFQFWYRNIAGGGAGFNLSDGLEVTFCP